MLTSRNLQFAYPGQPALTFPDLEGKRGEQWLLLGASGSGKTTWLQLLAGLRRPSSGTIRLDGTDLTQLSANRLDSFRGRQIGIIFQQSHFLQAITVEENLLLAQRLSGQPTDRTHIAFLLSSLNIAHKAGDLPQRLSQGEQQRVAIARALVNRPALILADEPTSALDDGNAQGVVELLKTQATAANALLLIVTHDNRLKSEFNQSIELSGGAGATSEEAVG